MSKWESNGEIAILREYLRIPSVYPNIDYEPCVEFLKRQAKSLDLTVAVHYPVNEKNPVVVLTWTGAEPNLPSIVLNSHMDVVPVFPERWKHTPFGAEMDADGKIFARGSQDMKSVGIQYLAAIRALKQDGVRQLKRTIHVTFVPDEEVGGDLGMMPFVESNEFKALNVGFSLDEGIASPTEEFSVFYAERFIWEIEFICNGQSGHGSLLLKNTPGEKIHYIIDKFAQFRKQESAKLDNHPELKIGDVTTVNLTMLSGGAQANVIPPTLSATFDIRVANDVNVEDLKKTIQRWCQEAGGDIEMKFIAKNPKAPATAINDSNPYWVAFKSAVDEMNLKISTQVFPAATDSRFLRLVNIPALGFSPLNNIPVLLHDHDEYILADTFLTGIEIYKKIIPKIGGV
ncbi:aminoacylase-1-like [Bradysia coprophila]|uniref:aminoacylase-1-like n=1 Tax=Bradysia coprophila TaxID=38358 RepID=UPI00187DA860|nr:aminoacylase-1-like [Bradysia coprophila]XP_037050136.1 aminoacylase-1-like [Bradysia coprophila]